MSNRSVWGVVPALLLGAACCVALLPAPVTADDARPWDGKWVYEAQIIGGRKLPPAQREEIWVEIKGGAFFRCGKGGLRQELELLLDPAGTPGDFVLRFKQPGTEKVSESKGIYRLNRDQLTLCYDNSGKTRPA